MIGPCPVHSPDRQAKDLTSFECDANEWMCATCCERADVIRLVELVEFGDGSGKSFLKAVEWLGGVREIDPAEDGRRQAERATVRARREREAFQFREKERQKAFEIWRRGASWQGTAVETYLLGRGIAGLEGAPGLKLRGVDDMPYWSSGAKDATVIARRPAMLAPIIGTDGRFRAVHITYLDRDNVGRKAEIKDADSGAALPAKKVRGSKGAGRIDLVIAPNARRWIIGEGIETVLSVYVALRDGGDDLSKTSFVAAVDLGNLGGKALATIPHPTLKDARGRAQRIPGPKADLTSPGLSIPDGVTEVIVLGDGDSDRFTTECAIVRAGQRFARAGRVQPRRVGAERARFQ